MNRVLCCVFSLVALGCGGTDTLTSVTGTIKGSDGALIAHESGTITFYPVGPEKPASGTVDQSGAFTMMTKSPNDGVQPGKYKVVVQLWKSYRDLVPAIPAAYGEASTTPLEVTVDADHNHFDFSIEK